MASSSIAEKTHPAKSSGGEWVEYDEFIDRQIRKTRGQVKGVEVASALMMLAAGALAFFLLAAVVDHWVLTHGLGFWGRLLCLLMFLTGAGYYAAQKLVPWLIYRINPIYAAQAIEKSRPSLKNSLINFLFLRGQSARMPSAVYQAVEEQAATGLSRVAVEAAVDRSRLIHIGYALLALVGLFAIYFIVSPKNPWDTVQRVVFPWADIQAPTRVEILDVQPGTRTVYRGEMVEVSAEIRGLKADEPVRVVYSTADHDSVDQPVTMYLPSDRFRHSAKIPAPPRGPQQEPGVQQDIDYHVEAGDAISPTYHLTAVTAPTITLETVDYQYPDYTGRPRLTLKGIGDIQSLEGTRITIHGRANQSIKSAQLELDGRTNKTKLPMQLGTDGRTVTASFTLALDEQDRTSPQFSHYRLRPEGRAEPEPVQYRIDVIPDLPPEVKFILPEKDDVTLPVNRRLTLRVRALDPDFALSELSLSAEANGNLIVNARLLNEIRRVPMQVDHWIDPAQLKLKAGDVVEYWATAFDNREPTRNSTQTSRRRIRIVAADARTDSAQGQGDSSNQGNPNGQGENANPAGKSNAGKKPQGDQGEQNPPQGENKPNDNATGKSAKSQQGNNSNDNRNGADQPQQGQPQQSQPQQQNKPQDRPQDKQPPDQQKQQNGQNGSAKQGGSQQDKSKQDQSQQQQNGNQGSNNQQQQNGGQNSNNQQQSDNKQQSGDQSSNDKQQQQQQNGSGSSKNGINSSNGLRSGGDSDDNSANKNSGDGNSGGKNSAGNSSADNSSNNSGANNSSAAQQNSANQQQNGNQQGQASERASPDGSDNAEAIKRILKHSQKNDKPGDGAKNNSQQSPQQNAGNQNQSGQNKNGENKNGQNQSGNSGQSDSQKGPNSEPKPGNKSAPQQKPGGDASKLGNNQNSSNGQNSSQQSGGQNGQGNKSQGAQPQGGQKQGESATGGQAKSNTSGAAGSNANNPNGDQSSNQQGDAKNTADKQDGPGKGADEKGGDQSNGANSTRESAPSDKPSGNNGQNSKSGEHADKNSPPQNGRDSDEGQNRSSNAEQQKPGNGERASDGSQPTGDRHQPQGDGQQSGARGGDSQTRKGESGAGSDSSKDNKPTAPSPEDTNKVKDHKNQQPDGPGRKELQSKDSGTASTASPHESDSKGDSQQDGTFSGGGGKGYGQGSNQSGTGGAGQNTAADQGNGVAQGHGQGDDSKKAGIDKQSADRTGQSGNQKGAGSHTAPSSEHPNSPNPSQSKEAGKPGSQTAQGQKGNNSSNPNGKGGGWDSPNGGGGAYDPTTPPPPHSNDPGDPANAEFAKKQFDMALETLKKGKPDLLKELNWTPEEAQKLADRLERMRRNADVPGAKGDEARRQMDDILRNLGPRSGSLDRRSGGNAIDAQRGLRESHDAGPPPEYSEQFGAFQQGILQSGK